MNKFIIAGNWKMNMNANAGEALAESINSKLNEKKFIITENIKENIRIIVCPPFVTIPTVANKLNSLNNTIYLGAQNCYYEPKGAFTGEVSIEMLKSAGCEYTIIGHSERRSIFGENDELINKKLLALLANNMLPILCIGELLEERQSGYTFNVLERQLDNCLKGVNKEQIVDIVIAYEPVWAIGTGISATANEIVEAHDWLRNYFIKHYGAQGENVFLLYGGSLNDANASEIFAIENVNGGLIGGASLDADKFTSIVISASQLL